jgi:hypothetical protein
MKLEIFSPLDRQQAASLLRTVRSTDGVCSWRRPSWRSRLDGCASLALQLTEHEDLVVQERAFRIFDAIASALEEAQCHTKAC